MGAPPPTLSPKRTYKVGPLVTEGGPPRVACVSMLSPERSSREARIESRKSLFQVEVENSKMRSGSVAAAAALSYPKSPGHRDGHRDSISQVAWAPGSTSNRVFGAPLNRA